MRPPLPQLAGFSNRGLRQDTKGSGEGVEGGGAISLKLLEEMQKLYYLRLLTHGG